MSYSRWLLTKQDISFLAGLTSGQLPLEGVGGGDDNLKMTVGVAPWTMCLHDPRESHPNYSTSLSATFLRLGRPRKEIS